MAKTRTPLGTLTGVVAGVPGDDVVAMVYSGAELIDQVDVASNGRYTAQVRPGSYRVKLAYIGSGNYTSAWVNRTYTSTGTLLYGWASSFAVARSQTVTLPTTTLQDGAELPIRLRTSSNASITGADVAVLNAHNSSREVDSVHRTNGSGQATLSGLAAPANYSTTPGKYWLRFVASGKKTTSVWIEVRRQNASDRTSTPRVTRWGYYGGSARTYNGGTIEITMANA
jgi:hypothetical protein